VPIIDVAPRVFKDYLITISDDDYAAAVSSFKLTPTTTIKNWKGGKPTAVASDVSSPIWAGAIKLAQDWETEEGLTLYLFNHHGETVDAVFSPLGQAGPSFAVTLVLAAPEIGGDIDEWGETTVNVGVVGAPVYAASTPAAV